jgi:hypothetical protein
MPPTTKNVLTNFVNLRKANDIVADNAVAASGWDSEALAVLCSELDDYQQRLASMQAQLEASLLQLATANAKVEPVTLSCSSYVPG